MRVLHNIDILCPAISIYIYNCYVVPARLFIIGGKEIRSTEGTTQGDPTAMATYSLGLTPMMDSLLLDIAEPNRPKMAAFADDLTCAGKLTQIKTWWEHLKKIGPKYGYHPQPVKSFLIVKEQYAQKARDLFKDTDIKVTSAGKGHLGAVIGSQKYTSEYVNELVSCWKDQLLLLSKIAEINPQAAYSCYVNGFKHKYTYFLRTIPNMNDFLHPIEEIIRHYLIPAITGGHMSSDEERVLLSLPAKIGGLEISISYKFIKSRINNSRLVTEKLTDSIINQNKFYDPAKEEIKTIKNNIKKTKSTSAKKQLSDLREKFDEKQKRQNDIAQEVGCSNWLTSLPLREFDYTLNKQQFWDCIRLRYNWVIPRLPSVCACGGSLYNTEYVL